MRRERYEMGLFTGRKFEILRGRYGRRLTLFTRWSSEVERTVKRLGVVELEFNHAKGWRGDDVSFLKRLPQLLVFEIIDFKIRDISEIHSLGNLRALDVNTYCDTEIDFSRFPLLEEASLEWRSSVRSLLERHTLRKLFINHYPGSALADFSSLIQLEFLSLKSPKIERIGDVSQLTRLQTVELGNARKLVSLEGIEGLRNLETLEIQKCKRITNINSVKDLTKLQRLFICDCGPIESLKPIRQLKYLKEVHFYESTNILDGDLSPLKELAKLEDVSFQERNHYNYGRADFDANYPVILEKALRYIGGKKTGGGHPV